MDKKIVFPMAFYDDLGLKELKAERERSGLQVIDPMVFGDECMASEKVLEETQKATPLPAHAHESSATEEGMDENKWVTVDLTQALAITNRELAGSSDLPVQSSPKQSHLNQNPGPLTVTAAMSSLNLRGAKAPTKPAENPYLMMKKTVASTPIVVKNGVAYWFNGFHYRKMEKRDMESIILDICRKEIEKLGDYSKLSGAYNFLLTEGQIRKIEGQADGGKDFITFRNGNLDIRTGQFWHMHTPSIFTTFMLACNYLGPNCGYECRMFDGVLRHMTGNDPDMTERLWQIFGYCLTPDTGAKKGFLFQGVGDSGKSKLCNYLSSFFPEDRVSGLSIHELGRRFAAAELRDVSLCISGDLPSSALKEGPVSMIKTLSGGDLLSADVKFKDHARFYYEGKFIMVSNHALLTKDKERAFEDRIVAVPFNFAVSPEAKNTRLLEDLECEKDVVASKAIDAYFRLKENNYRFAGTYAMNTSPALYGNDQMSLTQNVYCFLRNNFEASTGGGIFMADAYALYICEYPNVPYHVFSQEFLLRARQLYGAKDARKRRNGTGNPLSLVEGIVPRIRV